jgi:hypothetical protein
MPPITNPEAVRFVDEQIRPLCETARSLKAEILAAQTLWFGGLNTAIPNTSDLIDDGREEEGVSRLTGIHVNGAMGQLITLAGNLNDEIIAKPCVRPLQAE